MLFSIALLYSAFSPPLLPLSSKDRQNIELAIREETESKFLTITQYSYFRVKVEAEKSKNDPNGGEIFELSRTFSGWKVTAYVIYIY